MNNLRICVSVPPEIDSALDAYGIDSRAHFFRQCCKTLIRQAKAKDRILWPLTFQTYSYPQPQSE